MTGDHPDRDELVAYSLEALDPREAAAVQAHVPSCARCTRELEALAPAVAVLGESVDQLEPPPELRDRVLSVVREEAAATQDELSGTASRRAAAARRRQGGFRGFLLRPATGLAAVAIAVAGIGGYLIADNNGGGGAGPSTVPVVAQAGIGGTLAVGEESSRLDLHGLSQLRGRQVYQVWVTQGTSVRPSSNFLPDSAGRAETSVDGHLTKGETVMVTVEPHPGRRAPSTPALLRANVE